MRSQNTIGMLWAVWLTLASSLAVSPTADAAFDCMDEGNLCLESEGAPIEFRNLRIRELP